MSNIGLIIPAGGIGSRMNSSIPKTLHKIQGRTILEWTLRVFSTQKNIRQWIISAHQSITEQIRNIAQAVLDETRKDVSLQIIDGGKERLYSIANAIPFIREDIETVVVHDAVRPLVSDSTIKRCFSALSMYDAVIPGLQVRETIKEVDDKNEVTKTLERKYLQSVQTPQCFKKEVFIKSYQRALEDNFFGTDDASIAEYSGVKVHICEGNPENIKITYPIDLKLAELLIEERMR